MHPASRVRNDSASGVVHRANVGLHPGERVGNVSASASPIAGPGTATSPQWAPGRKPDLPLRPYDNELLTALLRHLGHEPAAPSPDALVALQRAFLDRVPYENLEIQLGRPTTVDPYESAWRVVTRRGGYCFHMNGALGGLLTSLGYDVRLAKGRVLGNDDNAWGEHMVLLVDLNGETWLADVGLGDGFRDPMPLAPAELEQTPFRYRLERVDDRYWKFHHDERASIPGFELDTRPVALKAFEAKHAELSTSSSSSFVQKLVVQTRRTDHALTLRGCVLGRADATGVQRRDVVEEDAWFDLLRDEFGLRLDDLDDEARSTLWEKVRTAHEAWDAAGRP